MATGIEVRTFIIDNRTQRLSPQNVVATNAVKRGVKLNKSASYAIWKEFVAHTKPISYRADIFYNGYNHYMSIVPGEENAQDLNARILRAESNLASQLATTLARAAKFPVKDVQAAHARAIAVVTAEQGWPASSFTSYPFLSSSSAPPSLKPANRSASQVHSTPPPRPRNTPKANKKAAATVNRAMIARSLSTGAAGALLPRALVFAPSKSSPFVKAASASEAEPSSPANWRTHRVIAAREIAPECVSMFVQSAGQIFEAYKACSESQQWSKAEQVITILLNFPDQTLRVGGTHQQRQALEVATGTIASRLSRVQTAASLDAHSSGEPQSKRADVLEESKARVGQNPAAARASSVSELTENEHCSASMGNMPAQPNNDRQTRKVRAASRILREGGPHAMSRAANKLVQDDLASMNAATRAQLMALHPKAPHPLPELPQHRAPAVLSMQQLDKVLRRRVHNGSAPGPSGWTGSHLMLIWDRGTPHAKAGISLLIRDICAGVFTGDIKQRLLACSLYPIAKKNGGVRPVAVAEVFVKTAAHCSMSLIEHEMQSFFPTIQYGVRKAGGSETAAQLIRAVLHETSRKKQESIVIALKTDFRNAFNTVSRRLVWQTLLANKRAEPILKSFHWQYADPSPLLVFDGENLFEELESSEGVRQGDPFASFAFALAVQPLYERALAMTGASACKGISVQDDFTLIGPLDQVMFAYEYVQQHALEYGLELRSDKCQVYLPPSSASADDTEREAAVANACQQRGLPMKRSMEALGIMFGSKKDIEHHCDDTVGQSERFFEALKHPELDAQVATALLRCCAVPKLGFLLRSTQPSCTEHAAARFDKLAIDTGLHILQCDETSLNQLKQDEGNNHLGVENDSDRCSIVTKEQLLTRLTLPVSAGGMGIRSMHKIRHAAYYASLLQMLTEFLRLYPELRTDAGTSDFRCTQVCQELELCRTELLASGAGNRRTRRNAKSSCVDQRPLDPDPSIPSTSSSDNATNTCQLQNSSPLPALQKGIDEIWSLASDRASDEKIEVLATAHKLQKKLTENIEESIFDDHFESCNAYQKAILTSLCEAHSGNWLQTLPTRNAYRLKNEQFRLAVRHRLGLLPYDDLKDEVCLACHRRDNLIPRFLHDPDHLHSCVREAGASVTTRHHGVVETLGQLARSVGFVVKREPPFAPSLSLQLNEDTGRQTPVVTPNLKRGDLLLIRHNDRLLIDVTIGRPTSRTELNLRDTMQPHATATAAEKRKHRKYDEACAREGSKMVPFAMESYGALGREARALLLKLAEASEEMSAAAFMQHALSAISVALQRGNAEVAARGTQGLRVSQADQQWISYTSAAATAGKRKQQRGQRSRCAAPLHVPFHTHWQVAGDGSNRRASCESMQLQ